MEKIQIVIYIRAQPIELHICSLVTLSHVQQMSQCVALDELTSN